MKIIKVWDSDYPWDIRVEKISKTLSRNGHSVSLVCRNLECRPKVEILDGVHIFRLPPMKSKTLNHLVSFPYFFNPFWLKTIYGISRKERGEAILVRDLPLALTAIGVGRRLGIPVVLDMAENYPAMLRARRYYGKFHYHQKLIRNWKVADFAERLTLRYVNKIIVVAEENRSRLIGKGVPSEDIYLASNTPDLEGIEKCQGSLPPDERRYFREKFTLIYVGLLGGVRGLEMVVEAMPAILKRIPRAHLLLIGKGMAKKVLMRMVAERALGEYITFKDWVNFPDLPQYYRVAGAGVIPHLSTPHTNTTLPNKIFDYMAYGLPVIASNVAPMKRIVDETKCGVAFDAGNGEEFVNAACRVYENEGEHFGGNGKAAITEKYNWKVDSARLLKALDDVKKIGKRGFKENGIKKGQQK